MLTIRMRRVGARKRPFFRLVVTESRTARDGRALEVLGHYDPAAQPETIEIDRQRLRHWVSRGAQPSGTVRTLLVRNPEPPEPPDDAAAVAPAPSAVAPAPAVESQSEAASEPQPESEQDA